MSCKKLLEIRVEYSGFVKVCKGYYHPRGCLGARRDHLDIESKCLDILRDLGFKHGLNIKCWSSDDCILLDLYFLNTWIKICPIRGTLYCNGNVYLMVSRSGWVYLGGVIYH